jgi:hypothetical protein
MFRSFFQAGFECSTGFNRHGEWIDQTAATQHDQFADQDYALLRQVGIATAREGVRWPLIDFGGRYDFSSIDPFLAASRAHGVEVIFDLFHFGYPHDVDLFSAAFPGRFAEYCYAIARYIAARIDEPPAFTPLNEPSYFAWAAGDAALFAPYHQCRGWELKIALVRAMIQGIDAIWSACPAARIVNVDALCWTVPPRDRPDLAPQSEWFNEQVVFQSWDMLCGRLLPELGGSRRHLGIVGMNYYWKNQWEFSHSGFGLDEADDRRRPLRDLVRGVWERYGGEVLISETSHVDAMRPVWLRQLAADAVMLLDGGVPLRGICLYPVLGMPEWHARDQWTRMGLWDLIQQSPCLGRVPYEPALAALADAQRMVTARLQPVTETIKRPPDQDAFWG